jgi:hypothetical protein
MIPLIAIQMKAVQIEDKIGLLFTTVLNQMSFGLVEEDEEVQEPADRSYWESRATKKTVAMADKLLEMVKQHDKTYELKYNKFYIGLAKNGQPSNFLIFSPKKSFLKFQPRLEKSQEIQDSLEEAGLDIMDYSLRNGRYRIRLQPGDIEKHKEIISEIITKAYESYGKN